MIIINWDFVSGKEVSFIEGMNQVNNFETNVLHFFCWDRIGYLDSWGFFIPVVADVMVVKQNGDFISLRTINEHTDKEIRYPHNVCKMLVANAFQWLPNFDENYDWDYIKQPIWEKWNDSKI